MDIGLHALLRILRASRFRSLFLVFIPAVPDLSLHTRVTTKKESRCISGQEYPRTFLSLSFPVHLFTTYLATVLPDAMLPFCFLYPISAMRLRSSPLCHAHRQFRRWLFCSRSGATFEPLTFNRRNRKTSVDVFSA